MPTFAAFALFAVIAARPAIAAPLLVADRPGNLFTAGEPITVSVKQAKDEVRWEVVDWKDKRVATGAVADLNKSGVIRLPALAPGYYELQCTDSAGVAVAPIGVVMDRGDKPLDKDGHIGVDAALAWCVDAELRAGAAKMVRRAGIPWVRERLHWPGQREGEIDWAQYQSIADAYALIKVLSRDFGEKCFRILVNTARSEKEAFDTFRKLALVADRFLSLSIDYLGYLPFEPSVKDAIIAQKGYISIYPNGSFAKKIALVANKLLDDPVGEVKGGIQFFLKQALRVG